MKTNETRHNSRLLPIVPLIAVITFIIIIYKTRGTDGHECKQYYPIYSQEIKGEISNIYACEDNSRMGGCMDIIQEGKKYTFRRFLQSGNTYSYLQKKDSIIKPANSYSFSFYRGKELIGYRVPVI